MRIKIYLKPSRDIELVAARCNPALDFGGIAKEVLRNHVRGGKYKFPIPESQNYIKRPLVCNISLDEKEDADIIRYLDNIIISKSALIRNLMLRAVENDISYIYTDSMLNAAVIAQELEQQRQADLKRLKKTLEMKNRE